ncbi:uncharacterized protein CBL_09733 [Carabus blaptoides fortunei]
MTRKSKKLGVKTSKSAVFDDDSFEVNSTANETSEAVELDSKANENVTKENPKNSSENNEKLDKICSVLDRLTLDMLVLMQRQMQYKLNIEKSMTDGELHISKSRYIMGHKNVSSLQLPTENSPDIDASITLEEIHGDPSMFGQSQLKINMEQFKKANKNDASTDSDVKNIQDPVNWFGVLVPRDLRLAQRKFQDALDTAVVCANNQIRLHQTGVKIKQLTALKHELQMSTAEE